MRRTTVAVALAMAVTVSTASTAVAASAQPSSSAAHASAGKPARPKKFAVSGSVTAVSTVDGTITIAVKGGTKGATITVVVAPNARVMVDGSRKSLGDIAAGYRIAAAGVRTGSVYTAVRVQARAAKVHHTPSDDPTPDPSGSPSPEPTDD